MGLRLTAAIGLTALLAATGAAELLAALPPNRTISLKNIHTDETITVEYARAGRYVPEAMERINWVLRDWRRNEPTKMDPNLIDLIWEMHNELGSREPVVIISGYRSRATNDMLRKTVGGQASESRHMTGQAADVQFPDIPLKQLRYSALIHEKGGVGYYPTSATPFVHVDTSRVRAWPRLPRYELALLFPSGRTQHQPAEGGPLTAEDARVARAQYKDLAVQMTAFHDMRSGIKPALAVADAGKAAPLPGAPKPAGAAPHFAVAALTPAASPSAKAALSAALPPPKLIAEPRLVDRPSRLAPRLSEDDRGDLARLSALAALPPQLIDPPTPAVRPAPQTGLASLTEPPAHPAAVEPATAAPTHLTALPGPASPPRSELAAAAGTGEAARFGWGMGWVQAPAWDEEHPEEVSYRPFPIAPFLTATASADDPALAQLVHPDVARTLDMLDSTGSAPPMRLRPGLQDAQLLWAQKFKGDAVSLGKLAGDAAGDPPTVLSDRRVRTGQAR